MSNVFVTSLQSRYIIYGSSNLTLKKNEDPGEYGGFLFSSTEDLEPQSEVGGEQTCVRTTNPSTGSPSHSPTFAIWSVNALTSGIELTVYVRVLMNPHSSAKASTISCDMVWKALVETLRPCK